MNQIRWLRAPDSGGSTGGATAAASGTDPAPGGTEAPATEAAKATQKPTLEELLKDPVYKAEFDARVSSGAKTEAERLATLSADERKAEEVKAFERDKAQFQHDRLVNETVKQLATKGLPVDLAEQLTGKDATETLANITAFEKTFNTAVEKGVNDRLKGSAPKAGGTTATGKGSATSMQAAIAEAQFKR